MLYCFLESKQYLILHWRILQECVQYSSKQWAITSIPSNIQISDSCINWVLGPYKSNKIIQLPTFKIRRERLIDSHLHKWIHSWFSLERTQLTSYLIDYQLLKESSLIPYNDLCIPSSYSANSIDIVLLRGIQENETNNDRL